MWPLFAVDYNSQGYFYGQILGGITLAGLLGWLGMWLLGKLANDMRTPKRSDLAAYSDNAGNGPKKKDIVYKAEKVPDWKILPRDKAMRRVLKYMARADKWFERKYLCEMIEEVYLMVREAAERRSVERVESRLTPEHADELHAQFKAMKKQNRRRLFGKVRVIDINILHVEAAGPKTKHTVTALVTAQSKDYVEDAETGKVVEGKKKATYYLQEFWSLRRGDKRWLAELVRPPGDVDSVMESKSVLTEADRAGLLAEGEAEAAEHVIAR